MSDYLPLELWSEVLKKLPIKPLVQCTCVCKSWHSLIISPTFITTHHLSTTSLLLLRHFSEHLKKELYSLYSDSETLDMYKQFHCPFGTSRKYYFQLVGSCRGLICLSDDLFGYTNVIILWNPSVHKYLWPDTLVDNVGPYSIVLGFGFDSKKNDYKVVRVVYIQCDEGDKLPPCVEVYSLRDRSWRAVDSGNVSCSVVERAWSQCFMNSAVHWVNIRIVGFTIWF